MAITALIANDDPILYAKAEFINLKRLDNWDIDATVCEMFALMYEQQGCGLAAPQIGLSKRLFILGKGDEEYVCINPRLLKARNPVVLEEGCLSFPGVFVEVTRPSVILVEFLDLSDKWCKHTFTGWLARAYQHELDHLVGKTLKSF